ncbi:hypothetical protein OpiT1DRAFT_04750 [Opitutaceae bacterium TAV1]|nr:hypothetical protein OpiT1DRAFT_04750 [Opitutaceae bacterium TAV1]
MNIQAQPTPRLYTPRIPSWAAGASFWRDFVATPEFNPAGAAGGPGTYTGATARTRINAAGLLETLDPNMPAFDFDPLTGKWLGLRIEGARTNRVRNSSFSIQTGGGGGAPQAWTRRNAATVFVVQDDAAPGGYYVRIGGNVGGTNPSGGGSNDFYQSPSDLAEPGVPNTLSYYARRVSGNATAKVAMGGARNVTLTDEWVRYSSAYTPTVNNGIFFSSYDDESEFDLACVQVETGPFASSYIPTRTAATTRAADITILSDIENYVTEAGTIFAEFARIGSGQGGFPRVFDVPSNVYLYSGSAEPWRIGWRKYPMAENGANGGAGLGSHRVAVAWDGTGAAGYINGSGSSRPGTPDPLSGTLGLGYQVGGVQNFLFGYLRRLAIFPRRLTTAQINQLIT